ncbi:T-complex protein 1 subunit alpha [Acorus calamus]|uniref:T-complex protein 1 subunit alpha n=1 Tax=Acorus calamus TaxID=4465 RepID=A0AAV9FT52_ACOCL|nr:T-complex protein 1 subunit alpha [Acorus calamus]
MTLSGPDEGVRLPLDLDPTDEGTDTSQGKAQLVSNINACTAVADVVRTTLGPRGMDKLIHDDKGNTTISNDGATIMKLLDIVHPASKILADIAKSQDSEMREGLSTGMRPRMKDPGSIAGLYE